MPNFSLEITSPNAPPSRLPLTSGQNMILGRAKESQIFLDSRAISRRHAELLCDPFGRWWVRDLNSHNGTVVNGTRTDGEQMLKPGDVIQVGEFSLALVAGTDGDPTMPQTTTAPPALMEDSGRVASLRDFETPRIAATHLSSLADFGQQLFAIETPEKRLAALCKLMVGTEFHGKSALVLRVSKERFNEAPQPLCDPQNAAGEEAMKPYISKTLLRMLLARNEPVLASNSSMPGAAPATANMAELSLAADVMTISAVACPIKSEATYTDLLYVLFPPQYGNSEWLALTGLAVKQFQQSEQTLAAKKLGEEHASIERELSRAHNIQKRLVPRDFTVPSIDYAIGFTPCRWVGGDYVDIIKGMDGKVLLTIADVCGKGLPAALVASSLHMMTHTAMRSGMPLAEIMQNLNIYLAESLTEGTFVTMLSALLDPVTGRLETINAGHPAGIFVTPSGEVTLTQIAANMPLGIDADAAPVMDATTLETGSYLVLFTDGLSELFLESGEQLGEEALAQLTAGLIKEHHAAGAKDGAAAVAHRLTARLDALQSGMARDDRTFLVVRRT